MLCVDQVFFPAKATLSADDIDYLKKNTRYDEQEIKEWYRCVKNIQSVWFWTIEKTDLYKSFEFEPDNGNLENCLFFKGFQARLPGRATEQRKDPWDVHNDPARWKC